MPCTASGGLRIHCIVNTVCDIRMGSDGIWIFFAAVCPCSSPASRRSSECPSTGSAQRLHIQRHCASAYGGHAVESRRRIVKSSRRTKGRARCVIVGELNLSTGIVIVDDRGRVRVCLIFNGVIGNNEIQFAVSSIHFIGHCAGLIHVIHMVGVSCNIVATALHHSNYRAASRHVRAHAECRLLARCRIS